MAKEKENRNKKHEKRMNKEEIKNLLEETISKMKQHTNKAKNLQKQEFQMKMHNMIVKTYEVTRRKENKYIAMYKGKNARMTNS